MAVTAIDNCAIPLIVLFGRPSSDCQVREYQDVFVANADGSFSYTPQGDWFGEDSFSYRVSDGTLDSNVATVRFTVTPVNDAPVIAPRSVTLDEDTPVTMDLLQGAGDVDGDVLTVAITTAP